MKTAEIFFVNGSRLLHKYAAIDADGEWLHLIDGSNKPRLSVSARAVLYIEHDVDA